MTVPSDNNRNDEIGNGATDTYNYTFKITSESDIKVSQRDTEDVETVLTLNVDYTVTGVGALNGGSIVLTAGNLTTDYHLTIRRDSALTQQTDVRNQGDFSPEIHEDTFDHLASVDQTQQSEIDRCVKVSETYPVDVELPGPQAGKVLMWNEAGDGLINVDPGNVALAIPADSSVTGPKIDDSALFVFPTMLSLQKGSDIASGAALGLGIDGNCFDITGTSAITSIGAIGVGTQVILHFDGVLTFTHHATDLILPNNGSDITTAAGDHAFMVEYSPGKWRCAFYARADGKPVANLGEGTVGDVIGWPTATPPTSYLECNGASLDKTTYADLFAEIAYTYGGSGANFNIPDYRGEFLRGWDHGIARDPDRATRTDRGDSATGDSVGTKQGSIFGSHAHGDVPFKTTYAWDNVGLSTNYQLNADGSTASEGGAETRPRNVNIMWCIRYVKTLI